MQSTKKPEMHAPAINKPKAMPKLPKLPIPTDVSAGLQKLPGLSGFEKPSKKMTAIINSVEMMPRMDV